VSSRQRPPVARTLVEELFLGADPMLAPLPPHLASMTPDGEMTHVSSRDIDMVLEFAPKPLSFWLELGAFEGGSAILTAQRVEARRDDRTAADKSVEDETSIVAVDTFLGDIRVLWERTPAERRQLLRPDGTISLLDRFRANVRKAGQAQTVLPLPATSVTALRLVVSLAQRGVVPLPQVIYLDSAHEEGEVLLEIELAWEALAPGGVLFGDDWVLPPLRPASPDAEEDPGGVQRDVLRFAERHAAELDDSFGPQVQPWRTLGRARPGLFVSYLSFQWFMRKLPDASDRRLAADGRRERGSHVAGAAGSGVSALGASVASFDCWSDGYQPGDCCDEVRHGPGGNAKCWDIVFTFQRCCPGTGA